MHFKDELIATVQKLTEPGKGLLAADESPGTLKAKFDKISLETNEENSRLYRQLLFTTKDLEKYISGVILFKDTVTQKSDDGTNFVDLLKSKGIISGIKLDEGLTELYPGSEEKYTKGLDTLDKRAAEFYAQGCRFAKWRCVLKISGPLPSELSIRETSFVLARYASICQKNGLVPIVEPELLTDGSHSIEVCAEVSRRIFSSVFHALSDYNVILEGCLFKPHMISPGSQHNTEKKDLNKISKLTVEVLRDTIPVSLGGIFFLSGGQGEVEASQTLHLINLEHAKKAKAWTLSFSFGRALQSSVVKVWGGKAENKDQAQETLLSRAKANYDAVLGKYDINADLQKFKDETLYVKDYTY
jgi:fructose-bisphosphate aldolase class I